MIERKRVYFGLQTLIRNAGVPSRFFFWGLLTFKLWSIQAHAILVNIASDSKKVAFEQYARVTRLNRFSTLEFQHQEKQTKYEGYGN